MMQFLIAIDQAINTLVWSKKEGFGMADETLSARMWRLGELDGQRNWLRAMRVVDALFFWDKEWCSAFGRNMLHCELSYLSELGRKHHPERYRET